MARSSRRPRPVSPEEVALRAAERRAAERSSSRKPENFGVSGDVRRFDPSGGVHLVRREKRVVSAQRRDPFDLLLAGGGLSVDQHKAAHRLLKDCCDRMGVKTEDARPWSGAADKVDGRTGAPELVTDATLSAASRVTAALIQVGPASARLLRALLAPLLSAGHVEDWRAIVQSATGETERHAQAAVVRMACEGLRLHYGLGEVGTRGANDDIPLHQCGGLG